MIFSRLPRGHPRERQSPGEWSIYCFSLTVYQKLAFLPGEQEGWVSALHVLFPGKFGLAGNEAATNRARYRVRLWHQFVKLLDGKRLRAIFEGLIWIGVNLDE